MIIVLKIRICYQKQLIYNKKPTPAIKKLTDEHRVSEAMDLIKNEKRLEELIEELTLYINEVNGIEKEVKNIETKLQNQINN